VAVFWGLVGTFAVGGCVFWSFLIAKRIRLGRSGGREELGGHSRTEKSKREGRAPPIQIKE